MKQGGIGGSRGIQGQERGIRGRREVLEEAGRYRRQQRGVGGSRGI